MTEERKDAILRLISEKGPLGVSSIARELNTPLTTMQKYLQRQTYFRMNDNKKWDLPENVVADIKTNTLSLMVNITESSILLVKSQLEETLQAVQNALSPMETLKRGVSNIVLPVANSSQREIPERIQTFLEGMDKLPSIIKSKKENLTEENYKMLLNTKWLDLALDSGSNYLKEVIEPDLYDLLLGNKDELSEESLTTIKEYQKNKTDKTQPDEMGEMSDL